MRDILLTLIILVLLFKALRKAEYGAYTWAWLSLMNPHKLTYGFAYALPWAQAAAIATLVSLLFSRSRKPLPLNGGVVLMLLLWAWMTITSGFSINNPDQVWDRWLFVSKIYLMLVVTLMALRGRQQTNTLIWVVVLSIAYFGIKGGLFTLLTGGSYRVWGPAESMLEENNSLAVGLTVVLPLVYYMSQTLPKRWMRWILLGCMVLIGASILGSQSRGALLALLAMGLTLGAKSKHSLRVSLVTLSLLGVGVAFMPESWYLRMDSIQNYAQDDSAMSRLYTWRTLWNVALDRPLVGSGFRADNIALFARYAPTDAYYESVRGTFWVAHSIYFQALGEHGFVGLVAYLAIWAWVWFAASRVAKRARTLPDASEWVPLLVTMCQVSTVGFLVGGAFLSLMNLDLPFYILAFVTLAQCAVTDESRLNVSPAEDAPSAKISGPVGVPFGVASER